MVATKTTTVQHLGGISAGHKLSSPFNPSNPTIILINSFTTNAELYGPWFANPELTSKYNLLAIEPLGHGKTRALKTEQWTFWDTSIMNLQVMDALHIDRAFVLGTSQGGFIAARMALLAPEKVLGCILLGTCMDREGPEAVARGCWDGMGIGSSLLEAWATPNPDFEPGQDYYDTNLTLGFGGTLTPEMAQLWTTNMRDDFSGEDGRKRIRMCGINLRDRDGLHTRLRDIKCPVIWLQGSSDHVYSVENAKFEIDLFTGARTKELIVVEDGAHFLSATNEEVVRKAMVAFVDKNQG